MFFNMYDVANKLVNNICLFTSFKLVHRYSEVKQNYLDEAALTSVISVPATTEPLSKGVFFHTVTISIQSKILQSNPSL